MARWIGQHKVKVSSEQRPSREALLSVELDSSEVEPFLERAYKQLVPKLNIAGFRKGKAPRRIVEQMYGREYLANEALDFLLPEVTSKALEMESIEMAAFPSISLERLDPIKYTATVPLKPIVDLGDYASLRVPKERVRVSKGQIEDVLKRISNEIAPWEPVDGLPAYEDLLNLDVHGWVYNEEHGHDHDIINDKATDLVPREGSKVPVPGFSAELIKLKTGVETKFDIEVPSDFENSELAGLTAHFVATLHSVKRRIPAEIDDELAKGVGEGFENLDSLKLQIKNDLEAQESLNVDARHKEEAINQLLASATIEVSPIIIDHELDHYLEEFRDAMQSGRMTIEHYQRYLTWAGKSQEEIRNEARPAAEERVNRGLVLREFIEKESIEITDDELEGEIEKMALEAGSESKQVRAMFKELGSKDSLRRVMVERKAVDQIAELALTEGSAVTAKPKRARAKTTKPTNKVSKATKRTGK